MSDLRFDQAARAAARVSLDGLQPNGGLYCTYRDFIDVDTGAVLAFGALLRAPQVVVEITARALTAGPAVVLNGYAPLTAPSP